MKMSKFVVVKTQGCHAAMARLLEKQCPSNPESWIELAVQVKLIFYTLFYRLYSCKFFNSPFHGAAVGFRDKTRIIYAIENLNRTR